MQILKVEAVYLRNYETYAQRAALYDLIVRRPRCRLRYRRSNLIATMENARAG